MEDAYRKGYQDALDRTRNAVECFDPDLYKNDGSLRTAIYKAIFEMTPDNTPYKKE